MRKHNDWVNLNEHALLKRDYQANIGNLAFQIQMNCILLIQCRYDKNPIYLQNFNHWKTELKAHVNTCAKYKLSKKNNYDTRFKYITYIWLDGIELLTDIDNINWCIRELNKKENTDINFTSEFQKILDTMIHRIIELIALGDDEKITDWIDNL